MTTLMDLRELEKAATAGPWKPQTEGNYDQRHAAAAAFEAVMARRLADAPDIQWSDLSYVLTGEGDANVALTGNGAKSVENAALIVALRNAAPFLLDVVEAAARLDSHLRGGKP